MRFLISLLMCVVLAGQALAADPEKPVMVKPEAFKQRYQRVGMPETMHVTEFLGVKDGVARLRVEDMKLIGKGWSRRSIGVKLSDLDPKFRREVIRAAAKLEVASGKDPR